MKGINKVMYHDDEDLHMCISCHTTIAGLENYISHRNAGPCKSQHSVKRSEAPIPVLPPLDLPKAERIRPIPSAVSTSSGEHLNFLNADFFFSSLELQSRRKDAVFEEVMGIEEVLEGEYEDRESGAQRNVYSSGGKWGYEDYTAEREMWGGEGGGKGGVELDGNDFREEDVELHGKTETFKEKNKKRKDKSIVSICETEENAPTFEESLGNEVDYVLRNASPTKASVMASPMEVTRPPEDVCMSDTTKESSIGEFGMSLESCNLVMERLNSKEEDGRYKSSANVPPSGHTRGKWVPGKASEGIRKSGNAVEYFCKPCNKNIRNRRNYEAHLSTSCHLKKLMCNSDGGGSVTTSEGPRLRSRRLQLSKTNTESDSSYGNSLVNEKSENEQRNSISDSQNYLMESLGVKRKVSKTEDNMEKNHVPTNSNIDENIENSLQVCDNQRQNGDIFAGKSSRKRKNIRTRKSASKKTLNANFTDNVHEQVTDDDNVRKTRSSDSNSSKTVHPFENGLHLSDESSPIKAKDHKDSLVLTIGAAAAPLTKKTENTSPFDSTSFKYPSVNLGYRCDSVQYQIEREKIKIGADPRKKICSSSSKSSDKSLQDEMMFGLELMRTDNNLPNDLKLRKHGMKDLTLTQCEYRTPEGMDQTKNGNNGDSYLQPTEMVKTDVSCNKVTGDEASLFRGAVIGVSDSPNKSREETFEIQQEQIVLHSGSTDQTSSSNNCISHYHAESEKIDVRDIDCLRKDAVNDLSEKASVATQTAIADDFELGNPLNILKKLKGNMKESPTASDSCEANDMVALQRPSNEFQYYALKLQDSQITLMKNVKETDILTLLEESPLKNSQIHIPDILTSKYQTETGKDQSSNRVEITPTIAENCKEQILESDICSINNEAESNEISNKQELQENSLPVTCAGFQKLNNNGNKNSDAVSRPEIINILNEHEISTQESNKITQENVEKESEVIFEEISVGGEYAKGTTNSASTENIPRVLQIKITKIPVDNTDKEKEVHSLEDDGRDAGDFSIKKNIPESIESDESANECSISVQDNAPQTLNIVINVGVGRNGAVKLPIDNQKNDPEQSKKARKPYPKNRRTYTKNTLYVNRYRPLLPKIDNNNSPEELRNVSSAKVVNTFSNALFPSKPVSSGEPLTGGIDMGLFQSEPHMDATIGFPSILLDTNPASSGIIDGYEEDVLLLSKHVDNVKVPSDQAFGAVGDIQKKMDLSEKPIIMINKEKDGDQAVELPKIVLQQVIGEGSHTEPIKYVCGLCGYQSSRFWCVERHITQHLPREREHTCGICDMQFFSLDSLKQHWKRHEEKKWNCSFPDCHQAFATKNELSVHITGRHATEKTYKCNMCDYSGKTSFVLERHMRNHVETDKNVECKVCLKVFKRDSLRGHMKTHDCEEFYLCPFCDYRTKFMANLHRHMNESITHPGKKLYSCPFCVCDENGEDERTSPSKDANKFVSNKAFATLEHINSKHPEKTDWSFKHHNAGELLRKLRAHLGIYNPFKSEKNRYSPERIYCSSVGDKSKRRGESVDDMSPDEDAATISRIRNAHPVDTIPAIKKTSVVRDLGFDENIITDVMSAGESGSPEVFSWMNDTNNGKSLAMVNQSQGFGKILDMENFVKDKPSSESFCSDRFMVLNPDTQSSTLSYPLKGKDLISNSLITVEKLLPQVTNHVSESETSFSDVEKEPQICCISNVFTMAESNVEAEDASRKSVHEKNGNEFSSNVDPFSLKLSGDVEILPIYEHKLMNKNDEVEVIDIENDEEPMQEVIRTFGAPSNTDENSKFGNQFVLSEESASLQSNKIRDSHCDVEQKTNSLLKQRKKKVPRWTSEVEIIKKCDGVISLWPTSP